MQKDLLRVLTVVFLIFMMPFQAYSSGWHIADQVLTGQFTETYNFTGNTNFYAPVGFGIDAAGTQEIHISGGSGDTQLLLTNNGAGNSDDSDGFQFELLSDGTAQLRQRENADMRFFTNGARVFTISNTGNVAIGSGSPSAKLDVNGTILAEDVIISGQTGCSYMYTDGSGNVLCGVGSISGGAWNSSGNNVYLFNSSTARVGINTTTPQSLLHIVGQEGPVDSFPSIGSRDLIVLENDHYSNFAFVSGNGYGSAIKFFDNVSSTMEFGMIFEDDDQLFTFYNSSSPDGNEQFVINTTSGYVGVGTANPAYLFDVNGNARIQGSLDMDNNAITNIDWSISDDGTGSGLDADSIDGLEGSQFLRSDADDTTTGEITMKEAIFTDSDPYLRVNNNSKHIVISGGSGWTTTGAAGVFRGISAPGNSGGIDFYAATSGTRGFNVWFPTSYIQGTLEVDGNLMTDANIQANDGIINLVGSVSQTRDSTYDVWIQGGASVSGGDNRNLALLGTDEDSGDTLYLNWAGEYAGGLVLNSQTTATGNLLLDSGYLRIGSGAGTYRWFRFDGAMSSDGTNYYNIWNQGNDGAGSLLDADLLDGLSSGSFLRSDAYAVHGASRLRVDNDASRQITTTGQINGLEVYQPTASSDALMTFHVAGDYAIHFGLDGGTNDLAVGGWSMGANSYRVWHEGNDGAGSGLAADTLDGISSASFARTDVAELFSSTIEADGRIYADNGVHVRGDWVRVNGNNGIYFENWGGGWFMQDTTWIRAYNNKRIYSGGIIQSGADMRAPIFYDLDNTGYYLNPASTSRTNRIDGTSFFYASDERLKENIEPIESALDKVQALQGVTFDWRTDIENRTEVPQGTQLGFIAQEVEQVLPELVDMSEDGYKSVQYSNVVPVLVEAIKEQQDEIDELKALVCLDHPEADVCQE